MKGQFELPFAIALILAGIITYWGIVDVYKQYESVQGVVENIYKGQWVLSAYDVSYTQIVSYLMTKGIFRAGLFGLGANKTIDVVSYYSSYIPLVKVALWKEKDTLYIPSLETVKRALEMNILYEVEHLTLEELGELPEDIASIFASPEYYIKILELNYQNRTVGFIDMNPWKLKIEFLPLLSPTTKYAKSEEGPGIQYIKEVKGLSTVFDIESDIIKLYAYAKDFVENNRLNKFLSSVFDTRGLSSAFSPGYKCIVSEAERYLIPIFDPYTVLAVSLRSYGWPSPSLHPCIIKSFDELKSNITTFCDGTNNNYCDNVIWRIYNNTLLNTFSSSSCYSKVDNKTFYVSVGKRESCENMCYTYEPCISLRIIRDTARFSNEISFFGDKINETYQNSCKTLIIEKEEGDICAMIGCQPIS